MLGKEASFRASPLDASRAAFRGVFVSSTFRLLGAQGFRQRDGGAEAAASMTTMPFTGNRGTAAARS